MSKICTKCKTSGKTFNRSQRYSDGLNIYCSDCQNGKTKKWRDENLEKVADYSSEYYALNVEKKKKGSREYRAANPEKISDYNGRYHDANLEDRREHNRTWKKENPGKANANTATRKASKLQRTPPWQTKIDKGEIRRLYELCAITTASTGVPHHVDHIIPLCGKHVSGLHVPGNLRIITKHQNESRPRNIKPFIGKDPKE